MNHDMLRLYNLDALMSQVAAWSNIAYTSDDVDDVLEAFVEIRRIHREVEYRRDNGIIVT